jgi:hypothetical protein
MSPVPGTPGIGRAFVLNVNVGAAAAEAGCDKPSTVRPNAASMARTAGVVVMGILRRLAMVMLRPLRSGRSDVDDVDKRPAVAKRIRTRLHWFGSK